ncbi:B2 protein [Bienertia sinuspersici]
MVGSRGKGSRSKPKGLAPCESSKISFDEPADDPLDGVDVENDSSNMNQIPLEEDQMDDNKSKSVISDNKEEQNALEGSNVEKNVVTVINEIHVEKTENVATQEGLKEETNGGGASADVSVKDNEDKLEEDEGLMKFGLDNSDACTADDKKSSEATTERLPTDNEGLDASNHEIVENNLDNLENNEVPNKLNADEPIRTISDKGDEEPIKENASITNEVGEATGQSNRPKRKLVKKKVVKKRMVRKQDAVVNEEVPLPSDENNAFVEACKTDKIEDANNEEKMSNANGTSDEARKADTIELASKEEKAEVKPPVKVTKKGSRIKKKKALQGHSGVATAKVDSKLPTENNEPDGKEHIGIIEPDVKNEVVGKSGDKVSPLNRRKKKKTAKKASLEGVPQAVNTPKPSEDVKPKKRVDSMGMIFMCSSDTKKDCYRYNVLGLPAGKKDLVLKIYKGMRLFLFDVDLRMMYGIYKAADPGGYNIEPRAFKSQYPSQVKNLCKLFHETSKKAESTKASDKKQRAAATTSSARRDKKRKRVEDSRGRAPATLERERTRRRAHEEIRHAPVVINDRYHERPVYKRETYIPSVAPVPIYQPLTAVSPPRSRTYSYDRPLGADTYRRDPVLDHDPYRREIQVLDRDSYRREIPVLDTDPYRRNPVLLDHDVYRRDSVIDHPDLISSSSRELRVPAERSHHEPYASYRELREPRFYSGPAAPSTGTKREHYDYSSSGRYAEYYKLAEDRPALPLYRRY